ncbi:hypothetical protein MRX96_023569 [Rhipicephalus microplus]
MKLSEGCIVTAPSLVRLGAQETVLVRNRANAAKNVSLRATDYPAEARLLFTESFLLGGGAEKLVRMKLDETKFAGEDLQHSNHSSFVSLRVHCGDAFDKAAVLLLKPTSGYLFVQTDKPVYSQGEPVKIRIVAVDDALLPSADTVHIEIKNPQDILTYTWDVPSEDPNTGIVSHAYELPKYPMFGKWKVIATYGRHKNQKSEVSFQVREYVLPTYSVSISTTKVILPRGSEILVKASYVYGKPVKGNAVVTFAVRNEVNGDVKFGTRLVGKLSDGTARLTVPSDELKNGSDWKDWVHGNRLFVRAVVVEEATGKQEATQDDSVVFSNSAYTVSLENTRRDFKPGTIVAVVADIRHANGEPANRVEAEMTVTNENGTELRAYSKKRTTIEEGKVFFDFTSYKDQQRLNIKVRTTKEEEYQRAEASMTLYKYTSPVNAFISIRYSPHNKDEFKEGNNFERYITTYPDDISTVFYQVMARGKIVLHKRTSRTESSNYEVRFTLTEEMAPKFRLLVFGFHQGHVVADSEDFDMGEDCSSSSEIKVVTASDIREPGVVESFGVEGKPNTRVGLLAVDKAAYLLGEASLLTRKKLFGALRSHDLSCGPGGGITADEVFANAGIVVISAENSVDSITSDNSCAAKAHRRKRDVHDARLQLSNPFLQLCCDVGTMPDRLRRHCSTREDIIRRHYNSPEGNECADAFAHCCARTFQSGEMPSFMDSTDLLRARFSDVPAWNNEEDPLASVVLRQEFRETSVFDEGTIGDSGWYNKSFTLPDSITTWSVQAVAVSPRGGVCVARPVEVVAFKDMFLQVTFPPTVVRNEQVEIVATLFNYDKESHDAEIYLNGAPDLCIASKHPRLPHKKRLRVAKNSAGSVSFPVVPLRQGTFPITVSLRGNGRFEDVQKTLTVVPEGTPVEQSFTVIVDPSNEQRRRKRAVVTKAYRDILEEDDQRQLITITPRYPHNTVPDTEWCTVSVIGSEAASVGGESIADVESLISMPKGCGEQTMMIMAPALYAYKYVLKVCRNDRYGRELKFRNEDGSFAAFEKRPGNVWLTAFVLKVFCEARNVIDVSPDVIEKGLSWLSAQQKPDGSFRELNPILHREMLGSIHGAMAMTAFVLLSFQECAAASPIVPQGIHLTIARAQFYIREKLDDIKVPYVAALTAYALSFSPGPDRQKSMETLKAHLLEDTEMNSLSTGYEATGVDVEGTSYALLAHLKHNDMDSSKKFVNWLLRHRSASGSFDTVVALQALSEYSIQASTAAPDISGMVLADNTPQLLRVKRENAALLQEFLIINARGKIVVNATGTGTAALNVKLRYNVLAPPQQNCKFSVSVTAAVYHELFDQGPGGICDLATRRLGLLHCPLPASRRRVGRATASGRPGNNFDNRLTYQIKVCTRYLAGNESNMAIVDVGIFTGFKPNTDDLKKVVSDNAEVGKYEERDNGVVFYLQTVKAVTETCLKFRIEKEFDVTNLQTSTVRVYDYYDGSVSPSQSNVGSSCSKSYGPESASFSVKLFCDGNMCKCATAECPVNETFSDVIKPGRPHVESNKKALEKIACDDHDYVWKGNVSANYVIAGYRHIAFYIDKVIKEGEENETIKGQTRLLVGRQLCNTSNLDVGREYIIFGKDSDQVIDGDTSIRYPLNHKVRVYDVARAPKWNKRTITWLSEYFPRNGGCNE